MVPEVAKQFFPQMAVGFDDPRVQVHITDGIKYVQEAAEHTFDVIIVDSSDPVGPAEVLFQKVCFAPCLQHTLQPHAPQSRTPKLTRCVSMQPFFEAMHRAVRPGGMVCTQVFNAQASHLYTVLLPRYDA